MYKVLIMNANGSGTEGLRVGGLGIPMKRDNARQKVIKDKNPDLILIQESDILLNKYCKQDIGNRKYSFIGEKDSGIIYDITKFDCLENPTKSLRAIYDSCDCIPQTQKRSSDKFFQRMCATILQEKKLDAQKFLCVSWHGPHKSISKIQKENVFHYLILIITQYLHDKQIPVILGGDFNLDLSKIPKIQSDLSNSHLTYHNYTLIDPHKNKIDYIITSKTITNVSCEAVDAFETIPELTLPILKDIFYHDPLVVNVTIPRKGNGVSNSSKVLMMKTNGNVNSMNFPNILSDVKVKVIKNENPDLILLQDNISTYINYDTKQFEAYKNSQDTEFELKELYSNNSTTESGERKIPEHEIFERMCATVIQEKIPNAQPFLFVSWNGPNNKTLKSLDDKLKITNDLIFLLSLYSKEYKIPFILGGDFCLDLSKMEAKDLPIPDGLQLHDYTLLPHRTDKSDFILTSQSLKYENCKPCDVIKFMDELRAIICKAILDHDPLVVSLTMPNNG